MIARASVDTGRELGKLITRKGRVREKAQIPTPEDAWICLPVNESLRIVDPDLAARVDARRTDRRTRSSHRLERRTARCRKRRGASIY